MTTRHVARHERKSAPPGRPCFSDAKNTTALSAPACERVRAGVLDRSLSYGGPLAGRLEQHVGNCVVRDTPYGTAVTKQHPDSPKRIDGAVAAIIAYDRAMWHAAEGPPREPLFAYA